MTETVASTKSPWGGVSPPGRHAPNLPAVLEAPEHGEEEPLAPVPRRTDTMTTNPKITIVFDDKTLTLMAARYGDNGALGFMLLTSSPPLRTGIPYCWSTRRTANSTPL